MDWIGTFLALLLPALAVSIDVLAAARSSRFRIEKFGAAAKNWLFEVLIPI